MDHESPAVVENVDVPMDERSNVGENFKVKWQKMDDMLINISASINLV